MLRPGDNTPEEEAPFATWPYHPPYLPPDLAIDVATGTPLVEPEIFYLRFARHPDGVQRPRATHALPLHEVTGVTMGIPGPGPRSKAAQSAETAGLVTFSPAEEYVMTLVFDGEARGGTADLRPELPLVLRW